MQELNNKTMDYNHLSYDEALAQLDHIVSQIEDDTIMLDTLTEKVAAAHTLIQYCEAKLRSIEENVGSILGN